MNWSKGTKVFNVDGEYGWNKSHAQTPVVDILEDRLRVYYATRDSMGRSRVSYIETNKQNPCEILHVHDRPILDLGELGAFDDCGVMPSCILSFNKVKYLYYVGWTTRGTVPYQNAVGLAISHDGGESFKRYSIGPIIAINSIEPYFSGTSFVMKDLDKFKMWYLSCLRWEKMADGSMEPLYHIKYSESFDGINWQQSAKVAIDLQQGEGGIVSASVLKNDSGYRMWYGVRGKYEYRTNIQYSYRIGYAESSNGVEWERKDNLSGINLAKSGWDSKMMSYPYVIDDNNKYILFYNGNGFGKSGLGYMTSDHNRI